MAALVLSLFPGLDLFGRAFELEGFCVVRAPEIILGQDIRGWRAPSGGFQGVIGGSPCQQFSAGNRAPDVAKGLELLNEFVRVVECVQPDWFVLENVPRVPDIAPVGYTVQRFDLNALECGLSQRRLRHFQFGSKSGLFVTPLRSQYRATSQQPTCLASEGGKTNRRLWPDFCELQGLPRDFDLPDLSTKLKYKLVGNAVPLPMGRIVARAVCDATASGTRGHVTYFDVVFCLCGCGRTCEGRNTTALPACRKRLQRRRQAASSS